MNDAPYQIWQYQHEERLRHLHHFAYVVVVYNNYTDTIIIIDVNQW